MMLISRKTLYKHKQAACAYEEPSLVCCWRPAGGGVILVVCVALAAVGHGMAATQPETGHTQNENLPVGNEVFANTTTRARITQRFEIYNPHSREQLRAVKEMGFTQVILDWPTLHAEASKLGLDVVMANWWTQETENQEIEDGVNWAKRVDPRRLVAVSMMDEPERYAQDTPFSFYQALYYELRDRFDQELPGVKLEISHWGPLASWTPGHYENFIPLYQATDRIRLMPYPDLHEGALSEVYYQMVRSRRLMELAGCELPQLVILQTWVLPEKPELPTIDELRVMAYQAMLAGADTLSFYNYDPELWRQTAGFTEGFAGLMQELTDFSGRHREATVQSRMSPAGVLTATIRPPKGEPVLMVVNTKRTSVDGLAPLAVVVSRAQGVCTDRRAASRRPCTQRRFFLRRRPWCPR